MSRIDFERIHIDGIIKAIEVAVSAEMFNTKILKIRVDPEDIVLQVAKALKAEFDKAEVHISGEVFNVVPEYIEHTERKFSRMKEVK
jgi:hypothetical protein